MIALATTIRNARLQAIANAIDSGSEPGILEIYTGPRPSTPGAGITGQTLLATLTFADPCADSIEDGVLTFAPLAQAMTVNTGTAAWARASSSDGEFVADMDVGEEGSGADIIISRADIYAGGFISVTAASITEP